MVRHRIDSRRPGGKSAGTGCSPARIRGPSRRIGITTTRTRHSRRSPRNRRSRPSSARWDADAGRDRPLVAGPVGRDAGRAAGSGDDRGSGHGPDRCDRARRHHHGHGRHRGGHPDQDECRRALRAGPARHRTVPGLDRSARIQAGGQRRRSRFTRTPARGWTFSSNWEPSTIRFRFEVRLRSSRPTRPPCRTRSARRRSVSCR